MTLTRAERNSFTAATDQQDLAYGESACLETPRPLFVNLHRRFRFDVDLTANAANHLLPSWIGPDNPSPRRKSAINKRSWFEFGRTGYSNPPYGAFIGDVLEKALQERERRFTSVFLLPLRAAAWYQELVLPYYSELWHCRRRITFWYKGAPKIDPTTKDNVKRIAAGKDLKPTGALFDSIIVIYRPWRDDRGRPTHRVDRPQVYDVELDRLGYR